LSGDTPKIFDIEFIDDLGADSLDIVELIMKFEDDYNLSISDEDAERLKTVQDVLDYLGSRLE
jgi:acyl carrier protein